MPDLPNVVFLLTDDQRFDTIHALGNRVIRTPNLDRLVRRGTAFTQACIPGGTSGAVCMPSRAMLHTGRTLFRLRGAGEEIPTSHTTLGEAFGAAGYATFGTGKWHNGPASFARSFADGAEIFFGGMADHWNVPAYDFDPTGRYDRRCRYVENPWGSNQVKERTCDHIHAGRHSTDVISEAAVDFVRRAPGDRPFLAYVSFLAPHDPRTTPPEFLDWYRPEEMPLPPNFLGGHPFDNGELHVRDELLAGFPRTPDEVRRHLAEYCAMISHLDDRIGRIVAAVRDRGWLENTLFVLAGDNGLALGQHGLMGKQSLYDHSIRVPLVFAGPGAPRGVRVEAQAYLLDVFPTLCDLCGVPVPRSVEGRSLAGVLQGEAGRDVLYLAYTDKHRGVRDGRWKLIEYVVEGRHTATQLFDLKHDPWEMHNLAAERRHRAVLLRLRRELVRLRDEWGDRRSPWGRTFWQGWGH
ncbi:MAG: sulfatase-like hydrolase/transferase [Candidatus Latescibacterota bacterium]|jgi:arylsulfatase A-like enzyme